MLPTLSPLLQPHQCHVLSDPLPYSAFKSPSACPWDGDLALSFHSVSCPLVHTSLLESLSVLVLIFYYFAFPPSFSCPLYSCAFCLCSCVHLFNILSLSCFEFSCSHLLFLFLVLCGLISPPRLSYIHTPSVDVHMLSYLMLLRCLPLNSLCSHLPF